MMTVNRISICRPRTILNCTRPKTIFSSTLPIHRETYDLKIVPKKCIWPMIHTPYRRPGLITTTTTTSIYFWPTIRRKPIRRTTLWVKERTVREKAPINCTAMKARTKMGFRYSKTYPRKPEYRSKVGCLLYTSDAADDLTRVDLGG